jgi:hypothetical protein
MGLSVTFLHRIGMAMVKSTTKKYVDSLLSLSAPKFMCRIQFKHLWRYIAVRVSQNVPFSNLTIVIAMAANIRIL